jgi:hypothetical protein
MRQLPVASCTAAPHVHKLTAATAGSRNCVTQQANTSSSVPWCMHGPFTHQLALLSCCCWSDICCCCSCDCHCSKTCPPSQRRSGCPDKFEPASGASAAAYRLQVHAPASTSWPWVRSLCVVPLTKGPGLIKLAMIYKTKLLLLNVNHMPRHAIAIERERGCPQRSYRDSTRIVRCSSYT